MRHPRFAHPRRRRKKDHLSIAFDSSFPTLPHHADLIDASDQRRHTFAARSGRETAARNVLAHDGPSPNRRRNPLESLRSEIMVIERAAGQAPGRIRNHNGIGGCKRLQSRGEVRRLSDGDALMRRTFADQLADHYRTGRDADPKLWEARRGAPYGASRLDQREPRENGPYRCVFVGLWIAKIDQSTVAHILGDRTTEPSHRNCASRPEIGDDIA